MPSIAQYHFPRFRWRNGEKRLWNPIVKKSFSNRPEERVRLRILDALIEAGWSKNRISIEETIPDHNRRTDIICYDEQFAPYLLVECKAESVPISGKVAEQTARYNLEVGAGQLLMSNGREDRWFRIAEGRRAEMQPRAPDLLRFTGEREKQGFDYWRERLFTGGKASPPLRTWITAVLNCFWLQPEGEIRYIDFQKSPGGDGMNHYYKVDRVGGMKLAITFTGTYGGKTNMIAVFNLKNTNVGLLEVDLDALLDSRAPNAIYYSEKGSDNLDVGKYMSGLLENPTSKTVLQLPKVLTGLFEGRE